MSGKMKFCQTKVKKCYEKVGKVMGNVVFCTNKVRVMLFTFPEQSAKIILVKEAI